MEEGKTEDDTQKSLAVDNRGLCRVFQAKHQVYGVVDLRYHMIYGKAMDKFAQRSAYSNCSQYFSSNPSTMEPSKSLTQPLMPPLRIETLRLLRRPNLAMSFM